MSKRKSDGDGDTIIQLIPNKQQCIATKNERETERVLRELSLLFPEEKFQKRVPRVIMKHMVYSRVLNRTLADKETDELTQSGIIRMFKLGGEQESLAILFMDQFTEIIERRSSNLLLTKKFISKILEKIREISIEKSALIQSGFSETDIRALVQDCLLTVRTTSTYWFCFPGAGEFMKAYLKGRQSVLSAVKKSKYQQILQTELESRPMKKTALLGVSYHIHDIIGADLVSCVKTTSGNLLKYAS